MRHGYKCIRFEVGAARRTDVDRTGAEFAETMRYGARRYEDRDDFLRAHSADWVLELREALKDVLEKERTVLSIGSGECEHEIPLVLEGYQIQASDLVPEAFDAVTALFPELPVRQFDILAPVSGSSWDDVLITGLDFYFEDARAARIFTNVRSLLRPRGRLIFTLRYRDSFVTSMIDRIGIPCLCAVSNLVEYVRRRRYRHGLKLHGYRRSETDIINLAQQAGFRVGRIRHAAFGCELMRLKLEVIAPALYRIVRRADRRLHWFSSATVFEFLT